MRRGRILEGSQEWNVLHHLQTGAELTPFFALQQYGILRLAARIENLRRAGHAIETRIVRNQRKHWASYRLASNESAPH